MGEPPQKKGKSLLDDDDDGGGIEEGASEELEEVTHCSEAGLLRLTSSLCSVSYCCAITFPPLYLKLNE